jgi:hypothetical protein
MDFKVLELPPTQALCGGLPRTASVLGSLWSCWDIGREHVASVTTSLVSKPRVCAADGGGFEDAPRLSGVSWLATTNFRSNAGWADVAIEDVEELGEDVVPATESPPWLLLSPHFPQNFAVGFAKNAPHGHCDEVCIVVHDLSVCFRKSRCS